MMISLLSKREIDWPRVDSLISVAQELGIKVIPKRNHALSSMSTLAFHVYYVHMVADHQNSPTVLIHFGL